MEIRALLSAPYFIPQDTDVFTQLQYFQENHERLGIIVDACSHRHRYYQRARPPQLRQRGPALTAKAATTASPASLR